MSGLQHIQTTIQAGKSASPAILPGAVTGTASYLGLIEITLSITLLALSIAYLLWRWRIAYRNETTK